MHARCILPQFSFACEAEKVETGCSENLCCSKSTCGEPVNDCEKEEKKQCNDQKGCDPATCCICCFALIVEPARFIDAGFIEKKELLPHYENNFISSYISTSWNPPEMV